MSAADGTARPPVRAILALPGDPETPTGGYAYARELLRHADAAGLILDTWPLPSGFPEPDDATLAETARRFAMVPSAWPMIIDGLALGVLPPEVIAAVDGPVIALCHHPLGFETGLAVDRRTALIRSERAALAMCAGVIATSSSTADLLRRDFAVPADRITVAPPGTCPAARAAGSAGPGVEILSVGTVTPRKGHDLLVAALAGLSDLDWHLTIVGSEDRDPACAAELRAQIARCALQDRVTLTGALDASGLERRYAGADLFALASRYEGFGMAYAEAMAHGLPVLGCDTGAVAEATRGAARLVAPDDPPALTGSLRDLITDRAARDALAADCAAAAQALPRWADTAASVAGAVALTTRPKPA